MDSFNEILVQYEPMIHKIMHTLHIYRNHDDYYQQGLIALWEAVERYDSCKGEFSSYAYMNIKGKMLKELNKTVKREEKTAYPKEEFWDMVEDISGRYEVDPHYLDEICEFLTANQRKWLFYTVVAGMSVYEIAEKEKVSASAVKGWRTRAREKLINIRVEKCSC